MAEPTGLELISEGGNLGWRLIGKDPSLYGDIGQKSIDFSTSNVSDAVEAKGAIGSYSVSFGMNTIASGNYTVSSGNNTKASGIASVAFGSENTSSGDYSFVAGESNIAGAPDSFVVGTQNISSGVSSFVGGSNSRVENTGTFKTGSNSFAFGDSIVIDNPNTISFGRFNLNDGSDNSGLYKIFTVGIGTSDSDRRNAFEVYDGGGAEYGSIKAPYLQQSVIDADITGKVLITKEYFENKYNNAFDDAPVDGFVYGRKNKGWARVAELAAVQVLYKGTLPPPTDFAIPGIPGRYFEPGDVYLQYNLPMFVTDGNINNVDGSVGLYDGNTTTGGGEKIWILRDGSLETPARDNYWVEMDFGGGVDDAPIDNISYVRKNSSWTPLAIQQIVWKGTENPNNISDLGREGDKYLRESYQSTGVDYIIDIADYTGGEDVSYTYSDGSDGEGESGIVLSGTPDISKIEVREYSTSVWPKDMSSINDNSVITINGIDLLFSEGVVLGNKIEWQNSAAQSLYTNLQSNGTTVNFHSELSIVIRPYQEYTKLPDGTWKSLNIERIDETPLDKILENADITSATYDIDGNILTAVYGAFADIPAGYNSTFSYINNRVSLIVYRDGEGVTKLTIDIYYDGNGNMTSFIRR